MGKTTLVRGIAAALGADADDGDQPDVHAWCTSTEGRKMRLVHLDLYTGWRKEREIEGVGLWEMADAGRCSGDGGVGGPVCRA